MARLPERFAKHEALTPAEQQFLDYLEAGPRSFSLWRMLVDGVLARRVAGYHADPGGLDPVLCGMDLLAAALGSHAVTEHFTPDELAKVQKAAALAKAMHHPGKLLNILRRLDLETRERSRQKGLAIVATQKPDLSDTKTRAIDLAEEAAFFNPDNHY